MDLLVKVRTGDPKGERAAPKRRGRRRVLNITMIPFRSSLGSNLKQSERSIPQQCCCVRLTKRGVRLESTLTVGGQGCVTQLPVIACATRQATAAATATPSRARGRKVTHPPPPVPSAGRERQPNFGSVGAVSGGPFPSSFDSLSPGFHFSTFSCDNDYKLNFNRSTTTILDTNIRTRK